MGGILGRLFREFAVTICVAILISGVVSVTLTPMLCSRFLQAPEHGKESWFYRITEAFFEGCCASTTVTLQVVLRHPPRDHGGCRLLVLVGTVYLFVKIPKGFIPDQDTDQLSVITEAAQGTSFYQMVEYQKEVAAIVQAHPDVEAFMSTVGGTGVGNPGRPEFRAAGGPPEAARRAQEAGQRDHRRPAAAAGRDPGHEGVPAESAHHPHRRPGHQEPVPVLAAVSPNKQELYATAAKLMRSAEGRVDGVDDVTSDLAITSPQINVNIDRDKAAALCGQRQPDRERVLRRLWPALGVDDLLGHQPVQSPAGTEAGVPGRSAMRYRCCTSRAPADS